MSLLRCLPAAAVVVTGVDGDSVAMGRHQLNVMDCSSVAAFHVLHLGTGLSEPVAAHTGTPQSDNYQYQQFLLVRTDKYDKRMHGVAWVCFQ